MTEPQPNCHILAYSQSFNYPIGQSWAAKELPCIEERLTELEERFDDPELSVLFQDDLEFHRPIHYHPMMERLRSTRPNLSFGLWADFSTSLIDPVSRPNTGLRAFENLIQRLEELQGYIIYLSAGTPLRSIQQSQFEIGLCMLREALPDSALFITSLQPSVREVAEQLGISIAKPRDGYVADRSVNGLSPLITLSGVDLFMTSLPLL